MTRAGRQHSCCDNRSRALLAPKHGTGANGLRAITVPIRILGSHTPLGSQPAPLSAAAVRGAAAGEQPVRLRSSTKPPPRWPPALYACRLDRTLIRHHLPGPPGLVGHFALPGTEPSSSSVAVAPRSAIGETPYAPGRTLPVGRGGVADAPGEPDSPPRPDYSSLRLACQIQPATAGRRCSRHC
jgi:hypothetical protein